MSMNVKKQKEGDSYILKKKKLFDLTISPTNAPYFDIFTISTPCSGL